MNKQDQRIQLVASSEFRQEVDKWRRNQTDIPSHSESIRRLVKIALRLEKGETMKMITAIIRPHKYNDVRDALITIGIEGLSATCLLYTSPSPRDRTRSRMPSSA